MTRPERLLPAVPVLAGATLVAAPERVLPWVGVDPGLPGVLVATQVLGARHVTQGVALALCPQRFRRWVALVDLAHAVTMVPLAVTSPRYRRIATVSGVLALVGAVVTDRAGEDRHR